MAPRTVKLMHAAPARLLWVAVGILATPACVILLPPDNDNDRTPCESDADCDDGLFCNGMEVCFNDLCYAGEPPCGSEEGCGCDELFGCIDPCFTDEDCTDGEFCNGEETCDGCLCQAGEPPCEACDEESGCRE